MEQGLGIVYLVFLILAGLLILGGGKNPWVPGIIAGMFLVLLAINGWHDFLMK